MISDDTLNEYLREVIETIINDEEYSVIKADQNAPRPSTPYCTVKILYSKAMSYEERAEEDNGDGTLTETTKVMRNITASFNFFKQTDNYDPNYLAALCRQGLNRTRIQSILTSYDLGLAGRSTVKNITFPLDSGFEERAQFTATFNYIDIDVDDGGLDAIDSISIEGVTTIGDIDMTFDLA